MLRSIFGRGFNDTICLPVLALAGTGSSAQEPFSLAGAEGVTGRHVGRHRPCPLRDLLGERGGRHGEACHSSPLSWARDIEPAVNQDGLTGDEARFLGA